MQNQISSFNTLFTISEFSGKKLDQFAIGTQRTLKNISSNRDLATYSLQNSLNCLYVRRIYIAFRSIKNYGYDPFKINNQSSVISGRSEKSQVQSMKNLLLKLKNHPRQYFHKRKQLYTSIEKSQSMKTNRKKLLNSIVEKLRNGRQELNRQNKIQMFQHSSKRYKSSTPDYNNSADLFSNRKSTTVTKLHIPYEQVAHETQNECQEQQKLALTRLLMKNVLQLKRQLFDAKQTTAMLIQKQRQQQRLFEYNRKNAQSLSQYRILTNPKKFNDQALNCPKLEQRQASNNQFHHSVSAQNKLNSQNKSQQKKPQVIINHHVHNYYASQRHLLKQKHKIGSSIKPYKDKLITELGKTTTKSEINDSTDNKGQKYTTYHEYGDRVKVIITSNTLNSSVKSTHSNKINNFSKAIRSRCIGLTQPQTYKNFQNKQST